MELNQKFFVDVEQLKNIDLSLVVENISDEITKLLEGWVSSNILRTCGYIPSLQHIELWKYDWKIIIQNMDFQSNLYQLFFRNNHVSSLYISIDNGKLYYKIENVNEHYIQEGIT